MHIIGTSQIYIVDGLGGGGGGGVWTAELQQQYFVLRDKNSSYPTHLFVRLTVKPVFFQLNLFTF